MLYAGFEPAILVDSVNIFAVYYSHNTTAACFSPTLEPTEYKRTAVPAAFFPWFRFSTR
jgi:hypothetical protein